MGHEAKTWMFLFSRLDFEAQAASSAPANSERGAKSSWTTYFLMLPFGEDTGYTDSLPQEELKVRASRSEKSATSQLHSQSMSFEFPKLIFKKIHEDSSQQEKKKGKNFQDADTPRKIVLRVCFKGGLLTCWALRIKYP